MLAAAAATEGGLDAFVDSLANAAGTDDPTEPSERLFGFSAFAGVGGIALLYFALVRSFRSGWPIRHRTRALLIVALVLAHIGALVSFVLLLGVGFSCCL